MDDLLDDFVLGENDDGNLYAKTSKGESIEIPPCPINIKNFFRKSTVLYGPSKTGKTILTKCIMRRLMRCFPIVFVFCPTNANNEAFTGVVPSALIYEKVTIEMLRKIYDRAKFATKVYVKANHLPTLRNLFFKVANTEARSNELFIISQRDKAVKMAEKNLRSRADVRRETENIYKCANETLRKLYKANIKSANRRGLFKNIDLTKPESNSLKFISYNPEILIVFDDCASELQSINRHLKKDTTLMDFFFKGRHSHLTTLYTFQDETSLLAPLRKNAMNTIFCTKEAATSFFSRGLSNGISTYEKNKYIAAAEEVFAEYNQHDYKRLIFCREDAKYPIRYIKGDEDDFRMCAKIVWSYCDKIKKKDDSIENDSEFYHMFFGDD